MSIEKKILYIDMDNVLVNFQSGLDKVDEKTKARFKGKVLHFGPDGKYKDWGSVVEYLMGK